MGTAPDPLLMNYTLMASAIICGLIALLFVLAGLIEAYELRYSEGTSAASKSQMQMYFTAATFASVLAVVCVSFYASV